MSNSEMNCGRCWNWACHISSILLRKLSVQLHKFYTHISQNDLLNVRWFLFDSFFFFSCLFYVHSADVFPTSLRYCAYELIQLNVWYIIEQHITNHWRCTTRSMHTCWGQFLNAFERIWKNSQTGLWTADTPIIDCQ